MTTHQIPEQVSRVRTAGAGDRRRRAPVAGAPWLPRGYLPRRVLWSRLDEASRHPVTMVVAPAGAGKTLGVAGWLEQLPREHDATWLDATRTTAPAELAAVLDRAGSDPWATPRLVIVDEAHLLPAASLRYVDERLHDDPDSLRIVLLTRWDLALSRLVLELLGHLTVLRGDVLRLSHDEAISLVEAHAGTGSADVRDAIIAKADGWCAALVLAARASAAAPAGDFARRCTDAGPGIADLVAGEVFAALHRQERHLLLCTAAEPALTAETARHLTRDPRAGDVLATLESTGLLVTRVVEGAADGDDLDAGETHFRIHPLLLEVARRRLAAGGVDVQQANATVLRAARLDLVRGDTTVAFRRLLALGEHEAAAAVLAEHGPRLIARGPERWVEVYVRQGGLGVEGHPETWSSIAWSRWAADDVEGGRHWADKVLKHVAQHPGSIPDLQVLSMRLHLSRSGADSVEESVQAARSLVDLTRSSCSRDPYVPLALLELGAAENWLGDLPAAEAHLSEAILVSRSDDLVAVTAEALSHLALTQFMAGREQACSELALESLALCGDPAVSTSTAGRAALARLLVDRQALPSIEGSATRVHPALPPPSDDLTAQFWRRLLASRLALIDGSVAEAKRRLEVPFEVPRLPDHLRVAVLLERAVHGLVMTDRDTLRDVARELEAVDVVGERLWVQAVRADLEGDLRRAACLYRDAGESPCLSQPPTAALALVSAAQLLDYLGDPDMAAELTAAAVRSTQSRRIATPFQGWSPHGTRVGVLLDRLPGATAPGWAADLRAAYTERAGVVATFAQRVPTARELASVAQPRVTAMLSPREHEVLNELARGSTYSDIAANLYVSENTVKTHISSLYSKLSVGRRSEALAVARTMHLL